MTQTATPATHQNVTVGAGRAVHRTADGYRYTLCGAEGRTPGASRLRTTDLDLTCKRCAAILAAAPAAEAEAAPEQAPAAPAPLSSKPFDIAAAAGRLGAHIIDAASTAPGTCRLTTSPGHARLAQAALIQAGYEAARAAGSDSQLTATLPEPEWPAGAPCSHCGGPTMAPTPGRPEEEGDYCPACGTAWR